MRETLVALAATFSLASAMAGAVGAAGQSPRAGEPYIFAEPHLCGVIDFPRGNASAEVQRCAKAFCQSYGFSKATGIESGENILSASKGSGKTQPYLTKVTCSD